jgi:probable phosphoglycerate mutase
VQLEMDEKANFSPRFSPILSGLMTRLPRWHLIAPMVLPLQLLLLRHGQTDSNARGIVQGHLPVPLNDLGHCQALALARRLRQYVPRIGRLICSDLLRASQSAEPVARALELAIEPDARWRERFMGEFQGQAIEQRRLWSAASGEESPPGAETLEEMESRVLGALQSIHRSGDGSAIAIMTHGGPIRVILRLLGDGRLPCDQPWMGDIPQIANCSILNLRQNARGTWRIACINDTAHLCDLDAGAAVDGG